MQKHTTPVIKLNQPDDNYKFQSLPRPSGNYPYHLSADTILPLNEDKLIFHMVGDTGGKLNPSFQKKVALEMSRQVGYGLPASKCSQFLYHLGDVVYHFGEAAHYDQQFFSPYRDYPAPIFAIAGNHDSDVNPDSELPYQSLEAFHAVFCDTVSRTISFSSNSDWKSMIQPHIYWTLETPLANMIGLHSNVPKYGVIGKDQREWFIDELKAADRQRPDKAILVCLHHAPYSADVNHGSSLPMIRFLEDAFTESGVRPDIVFSGHVHNYQRFHKNYPDGTSLPFIVAGAGGFDELHELAQTDQKAYTTEHRLIKDVKLMNFCDTQHGFLKVTLERVDEGISLSGDYYTIPHQVEPQESAVLTDRFAYSFKRKL
ncbi:metallophosphoesterase family protein [Spirosoma linguale]|uniref:Metallophosphoesterase n=1 Tax=Spirosoma linguale (strain ATCC 33905 / DSM 74 / LMG 10896 / Claus 1) TaxID=504472 RepID=D2QI16_SPILD|nr:metallophosphoesterase [Spirosoma linguale DSM 74]